MANTITGFTAGDLVLSLSGDGDGSGTYTDNQASAIALYEYSVTGTATATLAGQFVLPQTTTMNGSVTESAISGEYGSSSEGTLQLSSDGQSLVIAGYGINAATYNQAEAGDTKTTGPYGSNALAQTTSVPGGASIVVPRVVADINAAGVVDTSTSLTSVYNLNNPRSVATANGTSFYVSGQGNKDATQGVFSAADGTTGSNATPINTSIDTRIAELYNGTLYVSQDSSQAKNTGNISSYGTSPTGTTTATPLAGISGTVTLAAGQGNAINGSTGTVDQSPEGFFFANATTLYVADSGNPKGGTAGDGGLQKYTFANNTWNLDYTISAGLNLVANTTKDPGAGGNATTGLIGLTGVVTGGTVQLYATNATVGDLNATYLYGVTDTLAATTAVPGQTFTQLAAAPADSNIRGVAFAPQAAAVCFAQGTRVRTTRGDVAVEALAVGDLVVTSAGAYRPIRWLGHRTIECARHLRPDDVMPVAIAAHAFGEGRPARDLVVSPGHSIAVDLDGEVLIPAAALINGTTIVQEQVDSVTYWHVELESHDVILAEGLPAESYLDMGNRDFFVGGDATALHGLPDATIATHADFCRPFHAGGPVVALVRERLLTRAAVVGWSLIEDPLADLHLMVDGQRLQPQMRGSIASFLLPAGASSAWLVSETRKPSHLGAEDARALGLCVAKLAVQDGFGYAASMQADDILLSVGFHGLEPGPMRWTAGRALLPAALWQGCAGGFFLQIDFAHMALPRWQRTTEEPAAAAA